MRVTVEDASGGRVVIDGDEIAKAQPELDPEPWDGTSIAGALIKAEEERRFTLCVAYPCMKADKSVAADSFRDFSGPEALEAAAWSYLARSPKVGLFHKDGTDNAGQVVESYIWRAGDWTIKASDGSEQVVKEGDWLVGIIWGDEAWKMIKDGTLRGVSMQGSAVRRRPDPSVLAQLR